MRTLAHSALGVGAAAAWLAGCATLNPGLAGSRYVPSAANLSRNSADASHYKVLYSFHGRDGLHPVASLVDVNGTFFGTTKEGGTHGLSPKNGVVFSIGTSGEERVLHDFGPMSRDGTYPAAALRDVNGTLYGTTDLGNKYNTGTVFSISTDGKEHVVYSFGEFGPSPMGPQTRLIEWTGSLYGTTNFGGASGLGAVFSVTPSGKEHLLHSFGQPYGSDGQYPAGDLRELNGTFYGTTYEGGAYGRSGTCGSYPCPGYGTVFRISSAGEERVLHSFGNGSDGSYPVAGLIDVQGVLYGTTSGGGKYNNGTIFTITTSGKERVLYNFGATANDGASPMASLIEAGSTLYGTTAYGGANRSGTIFSISTTGAGKRILHSFGASKDGANPQAALIMLSLNGTLYGTTENGGSVNGGTVFALTP